MNRLKESNVFSGGGVIPLNNRRTLLKSYIWNYVVSNSGKATLENSIKGDIDLELIGGTEQLTTTGKNLFDESKAVTGRINPDNGELLPETSYISSDYIEVQEGETYFQSGSGDGYYRAFYDMNKKFTSIPTKGIFKITVPVGSKFLRISGRKERFGDWMIEKGDKATPYEPYTGLKSSPSPEYPQEIKSAGKWNKATGKYEIDIILNGSNLWKEDSMIRGHITANGEIVYKEDDSNCIWTVMVPRDGKYAVRIEKESVGGLYFTRIFNDKTSEPYVRLNPGQKGVLTLKKGENKIQASSTSALRPTGNEKVMLSYGDQEPPTYEAYQEPQPLILTSDRPITKWDKLTEQGGQYGWLYQSEVKEYRGENSVSLYDSGFYFLLNNKNITKGEGYCSELKQHVPYEKNPCISFNIASNTYAYTLNTQEIYGSSVSKIKEHLKIHPLHLVYKTEATEFVPLSESEQTQLRNLHSYNGTTHINVDSGEVECGIKVAYKQKK